MNASQTDEAILALQAENDRLRSEVSALQQHVLHLEHTIHQYETIIDQVHDSVVATTLDGIVTIWNRGAEHLFGYEAHEMLGQHVRMLYPPEEHTFLLEGVIEPLKQKGNHDIEVRMRRKSGEDFFAHLALSLLYDQDATRVGMIGYSLDITPYKRAEQEVRESERRFRTLFTVAPIGIALTSPQGICLQANPALLRIMGQTSTDVQGKHFTQRTHPDDIDHEMCLFHELVARQRDQYAIEKRVLCSDGTTIWLYVQMAPVVDAADTIEFFIWVIEDITQRKQLEQQLQRYATVIETTSDYIAMADVDGNTLFLNQAGRQLHGFAPDTSFSEMGVLHSHPDWALQIVMEQGIPTALRDGVWNGETAVLNHATGQEIPVSQVILSHRSSQGSVEFFSTIMRDITERKRTETILQQAKEDAEAASRAKSAFLANMSHELRTPLNAILGFTQLLLRDPHTTSDQHNQLTIINESGAHLLALINDVLAMSKIEAGRMTMNEQRFDLHLLLSSVIDMFSLRAAEKRLQLRLQQAADVPPFVSTDESKLRQVLMNLLSNAIKFTETGAVVLRAAILSPLPPSVLPRLSIEVEDNGVGIPVDDIPHLFEAFTQTGSEQKMQEGTGLGLPISRQFVRLMGGDMTISSRVGHGSVFRFVIPVRPVDMVDSAATAHMHRVVGLTPNQPTYRIMVVEDKWTNRKLLNDLLTPLGFQVCEAMNGQEAITLWDTWEPHLIFMDMRMPVMDGYEATRRIKANLRGQATAIIALTASAFEEERTIVMSAGCDGFIHKPFRQEDIFTILEQHLGVQFVYAEEESQGAATTTRHIPAHTTTPAQATCEQTTQLTPERLAVLPAAWVAELHRAAERCNVSQALHLIEEIPRQHTALADDLMALVDTFRFDEILRVTQRVDE